MADPAAPRRGSGSLENLRQTNRARILAALKARGETSRVELIDATGLARTTVSKLVSELLLEGMITERGTVAPGSTGGRPATVLALDPGSGGYVGIDFDHAGVRSVLLDRSGTPLGERYQRLAVGGAPRKALDAAAKQTNALLRDARIPRDRLDGAGAALSSPLHTDGRVAFSTGFGDWSGIDVVGELSARLKTPVVVGNDANLGALAEATFGAAAGHDHLLYVMLSAGVGAGLILHGRLYEGSGGVAGELGHVVVQRTNGRVCRCGDRGCLETVAGTGALLEALVGLFPDLDVGALIGLVLDGDPGATRVVRDAGTAVGLALSGICRILDPGMVVVGGELGAAGDALLAPVRAALADIPDPPPVVAGALGAQAEALGAAALAMRASADAVLTTTPIQETA